MVRGSPGTGRNAEEGEEMFSFGGYRRHESGSAVIRGRAQPCRDDSKAPPWGGREGCVMLVLMALVLNLVCTFLCGPVSNHPVSPKGV